METKACHKPPRFFELPHSGIPVETRKFLEILTPINHMEYEIAPTLRESTPRSFVAESIKDAT
jgi:hypothetical protein